MENDYGSFSPEAHIVKSTECLNKAFVSISGLVGEFDNWARNNAITPITMKILHAIYYGNCTKQNIIAKIYNLPRTTVNSNIKKMEICGLVKLKPLSLTKDGKVLAKKIEIFFNELVIKTEKIYGADPQDKFKNFSIYANLINKGFTGENTHK